MLGLNLTQYLDLAAKSHFLNDPVVPTPTAGRPIDNDQQRQQWQTLHRTLTLLGRWSTNASSCRVGFDALGYCPRRRRTSFSSSLMRAAACWARAAACSARDSWSS